MGKVKVKYKLYAKRGKTLLNVTENRHIRNVYGIAYELIYNAFMAKKLPYIVYMEGKDMNKVNKSIYGIELLTQSGEPQPIAIYLDDYRSAKSPIFEIRDKKNAPEDLEECSKKESK